MSKRLLVALILTIVSVLLFTPGHALEIDCSYQPVLLPYDFVIEESRQAGSGDAVGTPMLAFRTASGPADSILIIYAYNVVGAPENPSIVGMRDITRGVTIDDNPMYARIIDMRMYADASLGRSAVGLTCRRGDTVFVARYVPLRDGFDELFLTAAGDGTIGAWNPGIVIVASVDYDFDGTDELFVHVNSGRARVPNRLFCIDLSNMQIEWAVDVAGSVHSGNLVASGDSTNPSIIFATYNPKHNISNGSFSDMFCHLAKVNTSGEIEFNYQVSFEHGGVRMSPMLDDSLFVVSHSLFRTDPNDTTAPGVPRRQLSLMTFDGRIAASIPTDGQCRQIWIEDFDGDGNRNIYALMSDGSVMVLDTAMHVVDQSGESCLTYYVGRVQLPDMNIAAPVFNLRDNAVAFDRNFDVVAEFPRTASVTVLQIGSTGKTERLLLAGGGQAHIVSVHSYGFWTRTHHWLLKHENYVLAAIAILLLAVVVSLIGRQRATERLRINERRAAATIQSTPDLIIRVDRHGNYLDVHAHDPEMLPAPPASMIGKNIRELIPSEELREQLMNTVHEALHTRTLQTVEYDFAPRGKVRRYLAHVLAAGKDEIVATMRDITSEYEAQQELLASEARFRSLIEKSPAGVIMHVENRIMLVNKALSDLTGYSVDELLSMSPVDLVAEDHRQAVADRIKARREGFDFDQLFEVEALTKQGERKWVAYRAGVVELDGQDTIMVVVHDISNQKVAESQLEESNRQRFDQIRQVAGGLSHEIYNSLYPVRTSIEQLSRLLRSGEPLDQQRIDRLLALSETAINRAVSLTELVSRYSKIDQPTGVEPVDLRQIIDEISQQHQPTLTDLDISLSADIPPELTIECSSDHLYSLLNNLIINAIDAVNGRPVRRISVAAARFDGRIEVCVSDTGCGMTPEDKRRIFDPFFSTKPRTGTGLGLAVAQRIVDVWGGDISVESAIDKGTTFYVYLPSRTG